MLSWNPIRAAEQATTTGQRVEVLARMFLFCLGVAGLAVAFVCVFGYFVS